MYRCFVWSCTPMVVLLLYYHAKYSDYLVPSSVYYYSLGHALGRWFSDVLNSITSPCSAEVVFAALSHNVPDDDAVMLRLVVKEVRRANLTLLCSQEFFSKF